MRVLHVSSLYQPDQVGGAELLVQTLAETLARRGHYQGVACLSRVPEAPTLDGGVSVFRVGHTTKFFIRDWDAQSKGSRVAYKLATQVDGRTALRIAQAANEFKPDIINTHSLSELTPMIWPILRRSGVPIVHTIHDYTSVCTNGSMFRHGAACDHQHAKCRAYATIHKLAERAVDGVVAVGNEILKRHRDAGQFSHLSERRRVTIWNPIEPPKTFLSGGSGARASDIRFGFLGRIESSKGIDVLLQACRKLPPIGWELKVAGRAVDGLASLQEAARGLPITFVGQADREEFFREIDCLIVPSVWPEAFGRTVAEAYQRGVHVLGSNIGGIAEQIGVENADWLITPGDSDSLMNGMWRLVKSPSALSSPIAGAEEVLRRVAPRTVADSYLEFYQRVITDIERNRARNSL